jgi:hypothetical protein
LIPENINNGSTVNDKETSADRVTYRQNQYYALPAPARVQAVKRLTVRSSPVAITPLYRYTGWRRETGKFEVDYEIPPRGQVPSARGFVTLKRLVRL